MKKIIYANLGHILKLIVKANRFMAKQNQQEGTCHGSFSGIQKKTIFYQLETNMNFKCKLAVNIKVCKE